MKFQAQGRPLSQAGLDRICHNLGLGAAELWALLGVETRGFGFLADRRPQLLFERHVFAERTEHRFDTRHPDISSPHPGGYAGGAAEYGRLEAAMALNRRAALESASWGIGQVMGYNFQAAGHAGVEDMVAAMVETEDAQILGVAGFIEANGLKGPLQRHDWSAFARAYNGPAFAKNDYHNRLAAAYGKCQALLPDLGLRTTQAALLYLGLDPGPIDGLKGRRTRSALVAYQQHKGLPVTGEPDAVTVAAVSADAFPA